MIRLSKNVCLAGLLLLATTGAALASEPVSVVITGCVTSGIIRSEVTDFGTRVSKGNYDIRPFNPDMNPADMSEYTGKRIIVRGDLLPGDIFIIDRTSIKLLGACAGNADSGRAGPETSSPAGDPGPRERTPRESITAEELGKLPDIEGLEKLR